MYIKLETDDLKIEEELRKRGLWDDFISRRKDEQNFCWYFFRYLGTEQIDVFVGYTGFSNSLENGFNWYKFSNLDDDPELIYKIHSFFISNLTGEIGIIDDISTVNICAYCHNLSKLTREHIWSRCLIKRQPNMVTISEKARKLLNTELTVKDVCGKCNNTILSGLDAYICQLYDNYFAKFVRREEVVNFSYDFGKLSRWLLKISYNSSRAKGIDSDVLRHYAKVILTDGEIPERILLFLDIVTPTIKSKPRGFKNTEEIMPYSFRCARVRFPNNELEPCVTRLVALNSYYFYLIIVPQELEFPESLLKNEVNNLIPGTYLSPDSTMIQVTGSVRDAVSTHLSMIKSIESWKK